MGNGFNREVLDRLSFVLAVNALAVGDGPNGFDAILELEGLDIDPIEANNYVSAYWYAIDKDTPARQWWNALDLDNEARLKRQHAAVYRALRINPDEPGASYAVAPFRLAMIEGRHVILAAWPCPKLLDDIDYDWLGIETVLAWNPIDNTATVIGDPVPQLFGAMSDDATELHTSPRRFFQHWAARRATFAVRRAQAARDAWHIKPTEADEVPGALIVGDARQIRWAPSAMPEEITCFDCDPKTINKAILKAARLPFAKTGGLRAAA